MLDQRSTQRPAAKDSAEPSGLVCLAAVGAAHGVRGAFKLRCFTERPEDVASYGPLTDQHGRELFELRVVGLHKGGVIAKASGVDSREEAEKLRGSLLHVPREKLPPLEEDDEYYVEDLIGSTVISSDGTLLGGLTAVHDFGAGELIEWRDAEGREEMVPFTRAYVPVVDLQAKRVVVDLGGTGDDGSSPTQPAP